MQCMWRARHGLIARGSFHNEYPPLWLPVAAFEQVVDATHMVISKNPVSLLPSLIQGRFALRQLKEKGSWYREHRRNFRIGTLHVSQLELGQLKRALTIHRAQNGELMNGFLCFTVEA